MRVGDGLWLRILDVPAALTARGYTADDDMVLEVKDEVLPEVAGRWRLAARSGHADVAPTDQPADLQLDITDLGAVYLGGFTFRSSGRCRPWRRMHTRCDRARRPDLCDRSQAMEPARLLSALPLRRVAIVTASAALVVTACVGTRRRPRPRHHTQSEPRPDGQPNGTGDRPAKPDSDTNFNADADGHSPRRLPVAPSASAVPSASPTKRVVSSTFQVADEQYRVLVVDRSRSQSRRCCWPARGTADPERRRRPRRPWRQHWLELAHRPELFEFADVTTEVCDGKPSFVENDEIAATTSARGARRSSPSIRAKPPAPGRRKARKPKSAAKQKRPKEPAGLRLSARWRTSGPAPEIRGPFGTRTKLAGPAQATQAHLSTKRFEFRQLFTKRPECRPQVGRWKT